MSDASQIIGVIVLGVAALVGLAILSGLAGVAFDSGLDTGEVEIRSLDTETTYEIESAPDEPSSVDVHATKENAIALDGSGYVDGGVSDSWYGDDWGVCTTQQLAAEANQEATYSVFGYENETIVLEYAAGEWSAAHYVGNDSASASISATDPTSLHSVCLSWDGSAETLSLSNGDLTDSGSLTAQPPDRRVSENWKGTVDEIRIVNETVSTDVAGAYAADPVAPLDVDHAARYMLDEGSGSTTHVYYAGDEAQLVDSQWTDGVSGPDLEEGEDYVLGTAPFSVSPVSGGYLDGAPTMFVKWGGDSQSESVATILSGIDSAYSLIPIVMMVILASVLIGIVQRMRS